MRFGLMYEIGMPKPRYEGQEAEKYWQVMAQIVKRSVARAFMREELWNGNRERLSNLLSWDPEENITRWAWTQYAGYQQRYQTRMNEQRWSHIYFARLRTRRAAYRWLYKFGAREGGSGLG